VIASSSVIRDFISTTLLPGVLLVCALLLPPEQSRADNPLKAYWDRQETLLPGQGYRPESFAHLRGQPVLEIIIHGNRYTRDHTVLRELYLLPGDDFDPELLARDFSFIGGLGLFAATGVVPFQGEGGVELHYHLLERGSLRWGLIYPIVDYEDESFRIGAVYQHRSLLGAREDLSLIYTRGWEDRLGISLSRPWLGSLPIDQRVEYAVVDRNDEDGLHMERVALSFWLSMSRRRPLDHRFLFSLAWGERQFDLDDEPLYEQFSSLSLGYARDTRNSFTRPDRGGRIQLVGSLNDPVLGSSIYQRRARVFFTRYRALSAGWVGAFGLESMNRWGELFHRGVSFLGGIDSVRGHAPRSLDGWAGAYEESGPIGRNHLVLRGELRHDLLSRLTFNLPLLGIVDIQGEGTLFADLGFLWSEEDRPLPGIGSRRIHGWGGGLRIYTPVGDVLRLELGVSETNAYRIHLGSGMRF
jgi:outer membrane protein assembly factor BamA